MKDQNKNFKMKTISKTKFMFGNGFCFLFSKTCSWEYKEKTNFLYFWNKKHVWLDEIKKKFFEEKIENTKICFYKDLNSNANSLNETDS